MRHFLALATLAASATTCVLSTGNPDDLLTFLVSNNIWVVAVKPFIAAVIFWLAVRAVKGTKVARAAIGFAGSLMLISSGAIFMSTPLMSQLYGYIRIMDVLVMMLAGVVLCLVALEMRTVPATKEVWQPRPRWGLAQSGTGGDHRLKPA